MWATGTWSVRITDDKVVASTNLFYDGIHHLAWGGSALPAFGVEQAPTASHPGFVIQSDLGVIGGSDTTLTLRLTDDGDLSYRVAPYHMFGYECASLTLSGHTN